MKRIPMPTYRDVVWLLVAVGAFVISDLSRFQPPENTLGLTELELEVVVRLRELYGLERDRSDQVTKALLMGYLMVERAWPDSQYAETGPPYSKPSPTPEQVSAQLAARVKLQELPEYHAPSVASSAERAQLTQKIRELWPVRYRRRMQRAEPHREQLAADVSFGIASDRNQSQVSAALLDLFTAYWELKDAGGDNAGQQGGQSRHEVLTWITWRKERDAHAP